MSDEILVWQFLKGLWWFAAFILCGAVSSEIADAKGNNAGVAFFLGMIFGPLGLLAAWAMPSDLRRSETRAILRGERRRCPCCAELVRLRAGRCRYCGDELPPFERPQQIPTPKITKSAPAAPHNVPQLTKRHAAAIGGMLAALFAIGLAILAYRAGYRLVSPAEWWRSIHR